MIQPHPLAPLGEVRTLPHYYPRTFDPTHAVLCRNTAPLIAFAFACIEHSIGVRVLGRDIGQGLVTTIRDCRASSLDELEQKLIHKRNREAKACRSQGNESGAAAVEDKFDCLNIFVQHERDRKSFAPIDCIVSAVENLFDEKRRGLLTLSTIHKAKGLEWPTVFILDAPKLMPSRWANLPWQKAQEKNLHYVAVTRAKLNCFYIDSDRWQNESVKAEPQPSLSCDPSADLGCYESCRNVANPDDPNCQRRIS